MKFKFSLLLALMMAALSTAGCAPLLGAGAAIVIDDAAEREGGNLF